MGFDRLSLNGLPAKQFLGHYTEASDMTPAQFHNPLVAPIVRRCPARIVVRFAGLLWLAALVLSLDSRAILAATQPTPESDIHVAVQQGLLTLNARNVPLADLLRIIGERAAITLTIHGNLRTTVTESFTDIPLDKGITRLVGGSGLVLIYAPPQGESGTNVLAQAHVYEVSPTNVARMQADARKQGAVARPIESDRSAKLREIRALSRQRDETAARALTQIVAQDADPTVRAKAVAALGKFGEAESARAISMALMDQDALVRVQAARALGRVEGDQATPALGGVLMGDSDPRVRREAARALGSVQSEEARWSLEAAALDADQSVRRAVASALAKWGKRGSATQ